MKNYMKYIDFKGKNYKCREIYVKKIGLVYISTNSLNEVLFGNGFYESEEARYIDEQIFYFVEENQIELPKRILSKLVYEGAGL